MNARIQSLESERPTKKKLYEKLNIIISIFFQTEFLLYKYMRVYAKIHHTHTHTHIRETKTEIEIACYKIIYILFSSRYVRAESKK